MNKTIENILFNEFRNGAAYMCLEYFKEKKELKDVPTEYIVCNGTDKVLLMIKERTEAFDDIAWPMGRDNSIPLAEEIIANLNCCATDKQRENYVIDILEVFKNWAAIFSPIAEINEMKRAIELSQNSDEFGMLEHYKESLDYLEGLHDHYLEMMDNSQKGTMEYYLNYWYRCYNMFCGMLAAELAKIGINLLEIQYKRGIWLVEKLDTLAIQAHFGITNNFTYANNLLEELDAPHTKHLIFTVHDGIVTNRIATLQSRSLPVGLRTERAQLIFSKAQEKGYIYIDVNGWKWSLSTVLLSFLCGIIYCGDEVVPDGYRRQQWKFGLGDLPDAQLQDLFGKPNIGQSRSNKIQNTRLRLGNLPKDWEKIWALIAEE